MITHCLSALFFWISYSGVPRESGHLSAGTESSPSAAFVVGATSGVLGGQRAEPGEIVWQGAKLGTGRDTVQGSVLT